MSFPRSSRIAAILAEERRGSRRDFLIGSAKVAAGGTLATVLAGRGLSSAFAQGTPGPTLNFPELKVSITDKGYDLSATSVPAGLLLLTVTNNSKQSTGAAVLGPAPGQTMEQLQQEAATPAPNNGFPPFLYHATVAGGPGEIDPGGTRQAIIKIAEGDWVVFGEGNQPPTPFKATAAQQAQVQPNATFTVTEVDFAFGGFGKSIAAGKQLWEVVNQGTQPHMLVLGGIPANATLEQVMAVSSLPDNATPPPGGLQQSDFHPAGGVLLQSAGTTVWPVLDLPAGRYAALCFVGDPTHGGEPHAMEGMVAVFDVK